MGSNPTGRATLLEPKVGGAARIKLQVHEFDLQHAHRTRRMRQPDVGDARVEVSSEAQVPLLAAVLEAMAARRGLQR